MKADTNRNTNTAAVQEWRLVRHIIMGATEINLFYMTKMGVGGYDVML